jgi:flagellar motility protein MotE (MotC chaperone)
MFINGKLPMKLILIAAALLFAAPVATFSQTVDCPAGFVCISQEAANKARENALELQATKEKAVVLETALTEKDKSIAELRETARKNEADLKERLHKTEVELATKTGQLIGAEAERTRLIAITEFLLKHGRVKKYGILNLF